MGKPTLLNDIHDTFNPQADFMIAVRQMSLLGSKQKLSITIKENSPLNHSLEQETWELLL